MKPIRPRLLALLPLLLAAGAALAQQPVGRVLLAAGDAFAVRNGQPVRLQYNSPIEFKDTLRTGAASSLQVRFNDESLLSLRENTDFAIEDYQFAAAQPEQERAFFRLLKGGFRSVTGLIGRTRNANYRVQTQTATIGIRGTDYAARMCAGDCGADVKDGLYGSVLGLSSGTNQITIQNEGTPEPRTFGINEHFYVADARTPPQPLLQPPTFVSMRPQGKAQAAQQGGSGSGAERSSGASGAQAESRPSNVIEPIVLAPILPFREVETLSETGALAALPPANGFAVLYPFGSGFEVFFDDGVLGATYLSGNLLSSYSGASGIPAGSLGGGAITDTGSLTLSNGQVLTYGRWTGPTSITTTGGRTLSNIPVLFGTASGLQEDGSAKPGGEASYSFVGGPKPVDAGGNTGTVTSSVLTANFTQASLTYSLGMSFPSIGTSGPATFQLSGTGGRTNVTRGGDFGGSLSGSCTGNGCASEVASGGFRVGFTGANGIEMGIVAGGLPAATQAGSVVFLNAHTLSSFTPAAPPPQQPPPQQPPSSTFGNIGQIGFANVSAGTPTAGLTTLDPSFTTYSGTTPIAFSGGAGFSGNFTSATLVETGSVALVDGSAMNWGRWSGAAQITVPPNPAFNPGTGVPFVVGQAGTVVPSSGSFVYTFAGGPSPTNTSGVSGTWGGGALNIGFGASQTLSIATPLTMSVAGVGYKLNVCSGASCSVGPGSTIWAGMTFTGDCVGGACATGTAVTATTAGVLVGPAAGGFALTGNVFSPEPIVTFGGAFKR